MGKLRIFLAGIGVSRQAGTARKWSVSVSVAAMLGLAATGQAVAVPDAMIDRPGSDTLSYSFKTVKSLPGLSTAELSAKVNEFNAAEGEVSYAPDGRRITTKFAAGYANLGETAKLSATANLTSPVALVAARWPAQGAQPVAVLGRTFKGGKWTKWQNVGDEVDTAKDGVTSATDAWVVTNSAKAEIALIMAEATTKVRPQLQIIDPGTRVADRKFALPAKGETAAGTKPSKTVPGQAGGKDGEKANDNDSIDDSGQNVTPPSPTSLWAQVPEVPGPVELLSREAWGADPSWMRWQVEPGNVQAAVIHHTAGQNDYPAEAVPGILRSIYRYHAVSLGWGDIGYNVLVDNYGRAWQGRAGDFWSYNSVGGHALGVNKSTFGISVLGNYTDFRPSDAAIATVAKVITYKLPVGLNPLNLSTPIVNDKGNVIYAPVVSGHRDLVATSCPGQAFYDYLPEVRKKIAEYIAAPGYTMKNPQENPAEREQLARGIPTQLAGANRVETSISIASYAFPKGSNTVYVARADNTADALAGGALTDGPIVLVSHNSKALNQVSNYIASAGAKQVIALGGSGAIADSTLSAVSGNAVTSRLAGADRGATAAEIAKAVIKANPQMKTVYLAEQSQGIDALAAGSLTDGPVLLVPTRGTLPAAVKTAIDIINPARVVALGGNNAVSSQILQEAGEGRTTERIAGADRYHTSRQISRYGYPNGAEHVFLASGKNPVDAVAGGILTGGPILLLPNATSATLDSRVGEEISRLKAKNVTALGGVAAVSANQTRQALTYTTR